MSSRLQQRPAEPGDPLSGYRLSGVEGIAAFLWTFLNCPNNTVLRSGVALDQDTGETFVALSIQDLTLVMNPVEAGAFERSCSETAADMPHHGNAGSVRDLAQVVREMREICEARAHAGTEGDEG